MAARKEATAVPAGMATAAVAAAATVAARETRLLAVSVRAQTEGPMAKPTVNAAAYRC